MSKEFSMATKKVKSRPVYLSYPEADEYRSGCKVSWNYYRDEARAKEAAIAARHNAKLQMAQGYDFGYQCPGNITKMRSNFDGEWAKYNDMWEVCMP
jgi:hypothetical protein